MNKKIQKTLYYIEANLYEELDLIQLVSISNYSRFHFCRIFKLNVGESVMAYVKRLKLQNAAIEMKTGKKSMINIAFDAGYETPTGFLKAFKKRFGTTPTDFKRGIKLAFNQYKDVKMNTPKIVTREDVAVIFVRETGDYMKSGEIAWQKLIDSLQNLGEVFRKNPPSFKMDLGKEKCEAIGICHDDPEVTKENSLRYDAALSWTKKETLELAKYGFETKSVSGGKYAKVLANCGENLESWYGLYAWIEKNGYVFRDEPPFEKYLDELDKPKTTESRVEIFVPIE